MKVGDQTAPTNETHLKYLARYSVQNICGYPEIEGDRIYATVEELNRMVDLAAKCGISIDCTAPPFLESSHIDKEKHPAIMLAQSPERDRDIEALQTMIKNCAQAGIPAIKYNMSILGVVRTGRTPGAATRRTAPGSSPRRILKLRSPGPDTWTLICSGSESLTFSTASFRLPMNTRSAWPATPTTPACRPKAIRE